MIKIAIFASGSGSNAERIVEFFNSNDEIEVSLILTNNPTAGVIERAQRLNIPLVIFNKKVFSKTDKIVEMLQLQRIDWVILAGFLWLVPTNLIKAFENRMINIHPALLPKYGGKGMWGHHVHEAVVANKEVETGITIHYVNENYDEGKIIFQAKCDVIETDSAEAVAQKIHLLEYQYFPEVIYKEILAAENSVID
jgi:phosphoribosylglycinamide formyltransferase-1